MCIGEENDAMVLQDLVVTLYQSITHLMGRTSRRVRSVSPVGESMPDVLLDLGCSAANGDSVPARVALHCSEEADGGHELGSRSIKSMGRIAACLPSCPHTGPSLVPLPTWQAFAGAWKLQVCFGGLEGVSQTLCRPTLGYFRSGDHLQVGMGRRCTHTVMRVDDL